MPKKQESPPTSIFSDDFGTPSAPPVAPSRVVEPLPKLNQVPRKTALVYCEGHFGEGAGKAANGLARHSEKYEILSIIDSDRAGRDAGEVLDGEASGIKVYQDLDEALMYAGEVPDSFIFGMSAAGGQLSFADRQVVLKAIDHGMNIVNGLHEFLNDDPQFSAACEKAKVMIHDVRRPREMEDLRVWNGEITKVNCPRIAVLGTDCGDGKLTTATVLTQALREKGINAVMVGTSEVSLMKGTRYGVALDSLPAQFCAGEVEGMVMEAFDDLDPEVIVIEGQGALGHPADAMSSFILRGSCPQAVILQHAPGREHRFGFDQIPMPDPGAEIQLIEAFAETRVIGLALSHEEMGDDEMASAITACEEEFNLPVTDALGDSPERLVEMVLAAFPKMGGV